MRNYVVVNQSSTSFLLFVDLEKVEDNKIPIKVIYPDNFKIMHKQVDITQRLFWNYESYLNKRYISMEFEDDESAILWFKLSYGNN